MMFFKAVFALYLAAIALAAPHRYGDLVEVGDVGTFRVTPCLLCTGSSTAVEVDGNDIIKNVANDLDI